MESFVSLREDEVIEIARKAGEKISKCLVCGYPELWLKQINSGVNKTTILYKCGRCAFVNTTTPLEIEYERTHYVSYEHFFSRPALVKLGGEMAEYSTVKDNLIGHEFWNIPNVTLPNIKCFCGAELEITGFNPFYRNNFGGVKNYRCDIHCKCKNGHTLAFGVHVTEEEYEKLLEVKYERNKV